MTLYRAFAPGDEPQILALYKDAFGIDLSLEEWQWHYGRGAIIEVAVADERIVGHYAVQPRPFFIGARACAAGLVIGSMVAPEYRNVTTFLDLANRAYDRCRAQGIPFVYAFPNDNVWLVRRRMLSWQALPPIHALAAELAAAHVAAPTAGVTLLPDGATFDAPWLAHPRGDRICSSDPPDVIDWRLRARPHTPYPMYVHGDRGYLALKRYGETTGHIVAFRVAPGAESSSGAALLARALDHFRAAGVARVTTWSLPASPLHALLADAGFSPEPGRGKNFGYLALDAGDTALAATLADAARWDVAMADSDVF